MPQGLAPLWAGFQRWVDPRNALPVSRGTGADPVTVTPFPAGRLQQKGELYLGGSWVDVTGYIYSRDQVRITRGSGDWAAYSDPSKCQFTADHRDGRWSPRNPRGAWYGLLARNTPYRHSVNLGKSRLWNPARLKGGSYCQCPDTAALSVTGDLDIRWDGDLGSWREGTHLVNKSTTGTTGVAYGLYLNSTGILSLFWSVDGTTVTTVNSTTPVPYPDCGRKAVRATLDVNNGAGGYTVTFYVSDTIAGSWTQVGAATATTAGTTSIADTAAPLRVGARDGSTFQAPMSVYAVQVLSGIGGTLVADVDFTTQTDTVSGLVDSCGNGWSVAGDAVITPWRTRFCGEISAFPPRWDTTGTDVYVPIEASGLTRRLQQGSAPVRSSMYRSTIALYGSSVVGYWPMEDGARSTSLGSAVGGQPMKVTGAAIAYADSEVFAASAPLPTFSTAVLDGRVGSWTATGQAQVRFLISVPSVGLTNGASVLTVYTTGTAYRWEVTYGTGGTLTTTVYDTGGSVISTFGPTGFNMNGTDSLLTLMLTQSGADILWELDKYAVGSSTVGFDSGTVSSRTFGTVSRVTLNRTANLGTVVAGHLAVLNTTTQAEDLFTSVNAHAGETASARVERLCTEEGITFRRVGDATNSAPMGAQSRTPLIDLLRESAEADGGILYELRDASGFAYKSGRSLSSQNPRLTLDYTSGVLDGIDPTDDDQATRNDVTVSRTGGASSRTVITAGPLGTATVGVYDTSQDLNLYADSQTADAASWRAHVGTTDETRYPSLSWRLEGTVMAASTALTSSALDLDLGEAVTVTNPPPWLPAVDIRQVVQGTTETLAQFTYVQAVNCSPASPYDVGVYDAAAGGRQESRYSSDGTSLVGSYAADATALTVNTPSGPVWLFVDPFDIAVMGERMTVTGITGTGPVQVFTVTRAVNGITQTLTTGAAVTLWRPVYYTT